MRVYEREQSTGMRQSFPEASQGGPLNPVWLRWGSRNVLGDTRGFLGRSLGGLGGVLGVPSGCGLKTRETEAPRSTQKRKIAQNATHACVRIPQSRPETLETLENTCEMQQNLSKRGNGKRV